MEKKEPFENSLKADQAIPWGENILWINYNQTIDEDALGKRQNLVLAKAEKLIKHHLRPGRPILLKLSHYGWCFNSHFVILTNCLKAQLFPNGN